MMMNSRSESHLRTKTALVRRSTGDSHSGSSWGDASDHGDRRALVRTLSRSVSRDRISAAATTIRARKKALDDEKVANEAQRHRVRRRTQAFGGIARMRNLCPNVLVQYHSDPAFDAQSLNEISVDTTEPRVLIQMCTGDDIAMTQRLLGRIVTSPELTEKRLKRPTFRFLHDVVVAVSQATGFASSLYDEGVAHDADKNSKRDFLDRIIKVVGLQIYPLVHDRTSSQDLPGWTRWWWLRNDVRPSNMVAGLSVQQTNRFLQLLAVASVHFSDSAMAVKAVRSFVDSSTGDEIAMPVPCWDAATSAAAASADPGPEQDGGDTMTLFVKMPDGHTAVLHDLAPSCEVEELHQLLQDVERHDGSSAPSPSPSLQGSGGCHLQLVYSSKHLQPGRTVGDYNLHNGSTIFGLLRVLGGGSDEAGQLPVEAPARSVEQSNTIEKGLSPDPVAGAAAAAVAAPEERRASPRRSTRAKALIPSPAEPSLLETQVLRSSPLATAATTGLLTAATGAATAAATAATTAATAAATAEVTTAQADDPLAGTPAGGFVRTMRAKARAGRGQGDLVSSLREWVSGGCRDGRALVSTWDHVPGALFCQEAPFVTNNDSKCDRWRQPPKMDGIGCKCRGDCAHAYATGPRQPPPMPPALPKPLSIPPIETGVAEPARPVAPGPTPSQLAKISIDLIESFTPPKYHPVYVALVNSRDPDEVDMPWYFNPGANELENVTCSGYAYFVNDACTDALTSDEIDTFLKEWGMEDGDELLAETIKAWNGSFHGMDDFRSHMQLNAWLKENFTCDKKALDALPDDKRRHLLLYNLQMDAHRAAEEARRVHGTWLDLDRAGQEARADDIKRFQRAWEAFEANGDAFEYAAASEHEAALSVTENARLYWRNATEFYNGKSDFEGMMQVWTANEKARERLRKKWDKFKADICAYERAGFSWPSTEVAKPINPAEKKELYEKEWTKQLRSKSGFRRALAGLTEEIRIAQAQTRHLPETAPKRNVDTLWELHKAQAMAHTNEPRQLISNIDDLGELSRRLDPHFQKVLAFWMAGLGGQIINRTKSKRQMVQQLMSIDYDGTRLTDILSGSVDFATPEGLKTCLQRIRTDDRVVLVDVKNYLDSKAPESVAPDGTHQVWVYLTIVDDYTLRQVRVQAEDRLDGFVCEVKLGLLVLENGPGKHEDRMHAKWQSATKKRATKELLVASGLNAGANAMLIEGRTAQLQANQAVDHATEALLESNRLYEESIAASAEADRRQIENQSTFDARRNGAAEATGALERARAAGQKAEARKEEVARLDQKDAAEVRRKKLEKEKYAIIAAKLAAAKLAEKLHQRKQEEEDALKEEEGMTDEERMEQELARTRARMEILKTIKAFRKFSEDKLRRAAEDLEEEEYAAGDVVISQGDIGEEFFIIDKGFACVFVTKNLDPTDPLANAKEVTRLKEKAYFGEVALLKGERRSATIVAGEGGLTALKMDKAMFKNIMENKGTKSGTWENGMVAKNKKNKDPNFPFTWWTGPSQMPQVKLKAGVRVEANFKGKNMMMPGVICKIGNGKYSVKYESGEIESNVRSENITVSLVVNDRIAARYNGMKKYYSGKITRVGADGSYNVQYDDGEEEYAMRRDYIGVLALVDNRIDEFQEAANAAANGSGADGDDGSRGENKRELTREEQIQLLYEEEMIRVQARVTKRRTRLVGTHGHSQLSMNEHLSQLGKLSSPLGGGGGGTAKQLDYDRLRRPIKSLSDGEAEEEDSDGDD